MNIAKIARKIQGQIHQFSGKLSRRLPKVARRFIEEMIYGIQTRGSVRLSKIARSLNEEIPLRKTVKIVKKSRFLKHFSGRAKGL